MDTYTIHICDSVNNKLKSKMIIYLITKVASYRDQNGKISKSVLKSVYISWSGKIPKTCVQSIMVQILFLELGLKDFVSLSLEQVHACVSQKMGQYSVVGSWLHNQAPSYCHSTSVTNSLFFIFVLVFFFSIFSCHAKLGPLGPTHGWSSTEAGL